MINLADLSLAPVPKRISPRQGQFNINGKKYIKLEADEPQLLIPAAHKTGLDWELTASPKAPKDQIGLTLRLSAGSGIQPEGYKLLVNPSGIEITASDPRGAFYGACTLVQILRQSNQAIPCLSITDWPDMPARGVMLDISRDKVPTMETLYHLVDLLAELKINQFQLYTEHTFAYLAHPVVWEQASPMTGEEVLALDKYCKDRFIELVPNQNSFGHMERWLKHKEYAHLAEAPNGFDTPWGHYDYPYSLCPTDKRSLPFIRGLYDEFLPHFSSKLFNVGCDETFDLGQGRSKKACEERGKGRVYLDFLLQIHQSIEERGRTMMFWGDIILHHPELIPLLPTNSRSRLRSAIIVLEWGYEYDHPFAKNCKKFSESGIPFYVCPGTSSWNTLCGRTENMIDNITNAAKAGMKYGSIGLLNTDWGDNGHWQPLSTAYLGYLAGAMLSWNTKTDLRPILAQNLSVNVLGDATGKSGRALYDLGNLYRVFKKRVFNCSVSWQMLFHGPEVMDGLEMREFEEFDEKLKGIMEAFAGSKMTSPNAGIVREEITHIFKLLKLSSTVGKTRLGAKRPARLPEKLEEAKKSHKEVWLLRNRPGGLSDSTSKIKNP